MNRLILFFLTVVVLLGGCQYLSTATSNEIVLARVHNKYLCYSDIQDMIVGKGLSSQDSLTIVQNVVNSWVRKQLLLDQAEKTLTPDEKDFSKQLEEYRNSLVIYEFESSIISQKLDTVVSLKEIQTYYDQNMQNFELKENIIKADYVQILDDQKQLPRLKKLWQNHDIRSKTELEKYCIQNGLNYSLFDDSWIYFSDLLNIIPINTYNQENFIRYNRNIEVMDSLYVYLVEIKDFKIKESIAPLSMHENNIRQIIVNRRKLELLQNLQNEIYENALTNNYFEIY
ncbi:MAG: hypothetical protein GX128_01365 [Bacteroidales bacterium]|jgi:hypothetical protein|nr:hypothetical protein [Bacteroidales bacterium]